MKASSGQSKILLDDLTVHRTAWALGTFVNIKPSYFRSGNCRRTQLSDIWKRCDSSMSRHSSVPGALPKLLIRNLRFVCRLLQAGALYNAFHRPYPVHVGITFVSPLIRELTYKWDPALPLTAISAFRGLSSHHRANHFFAGSSPECLEQSAD